ncbi:hypothetical protein ARMGADRAFT_1092740 [Armillaria gallica]|uniref:FAD dependent oxidoreductase domain-containing protein n=1 Tax=Armillaria gallica TaxID=47427 RepID=A0A2H3CUS5_ARMGA|nr:hypothetical protein ARMGADRAFT_1092740 [Armillaria gallica]
MPPLHYDYPGLKEKHSAEAAKQVIHLRLSHLDELISVSEEEGLTEKSQCRKTYSSFQLYTHTPCLSIYDNTIHTPRGDIHTKHIVLTTNGWTSHLLAPMREKIVPVRGHMTARRAGTGLDDGCLGTWSSRPLGEKSHAEFMFGSGIEMGIPSFFDTVRCVDDRQIEFRVCVYLGGALAYHGK